MIFELDALFNEITQMWFYRLTVYRFGTGGFVSRVTDPDESQND